ncbi:MAG: bifunctional proline dehydrogenase/L-glutamate gamma-semialdehyde dehydrogenase PutA [Brevirhabdus sp.]
MNVIDPKWDRNKRQDETKLLRALISIAALDDATRARIVRQATNLVKRIRNASRPGMMDVFLAEYGLSTDEGVALMCLAEALLRVPDAQTIDALIEDKIAPSNWSSHIGHSSSPLVNASTWGLLLTGKVLGDDAPGIAGRLRAMIKRLGEPVIRTAVAGAMREMGRQFVLGQTIEDAMTRAAKSESRGYTYSYDMLGEAAMTAADAARYADAYEAAIDTISAACTHSDIAANPGISVKLSALHPRYEVAKTARVMSELVPVLTRLCRKAAGAGMGLNIDAEEMDHLSLSMHVIETVLADPDLKGWHGFGVVVQAYGRRARDIIDGLHAMAVEHDRRIMVRLVKGAYWDTEIKHAQVEGLDDFPVFTRKAASDVSYIALARHLLGMTDRIYPQFATHNAHTVAAVLELAKGHDTSCFEFQRLHGMGEALHDVVRVDHATRCRVYAPVGAHRDLLAYLVRRLLENGANSSFVNQITDTSVAPDRVAACPFAAIQADPDPFEPRLKTAPEMFRPQRENSKGFDLFDTITLARLAQDRMRPAPLSPGPILAGPLHGGEVEPTFNPATGEQTGTVTLSSERDVETALDAARPWGGKASDRAAILNRAADLYERDHVEVFALLATEAGKTLPDAVAELREAVDFLRYYAAGAGALEHPARGLITCISPWNFPLAIFTGQIAAALTAGNGVLAKPAETTPAIAQWGVARLHEAGVPVSALQLLPGHGHVVGAALTSDPRINGVAFTGSTETARRIQRAMAENCAPGTPLIAETGGLNAMVVDSTALPEQAVRDIIVSAFQSAGQRCSALRCLYVQEDIADDFIHMLTGAMDELELGNPWHLSTDVGPVITDTAKRDIESHIETARKSGRLLHQLRTPSPGHFVPPTLIHVAGIKDLEREVFGPVLHIATFKTNELNRVISDVNGTGYGLTFGLHTRIDERVQHFADTIRAGNIYANRNQIGAIVGSQPFGGEGLSGTGPKAGGPHYLERFTHRPRDAAPVRHTHTPLHLPGPTGELNRLTTLPRAPLLCLGPGPEAQARQIAAIDALGGETTTATTLPAPEQLASIPNLGGVLWWGEDRTARCYARALATREGPIVPLITDGPDLAHACHERHLCVDTTAAGGNVGLLSGDGA